jgi:NarL family two-component system response regulator LiaR
MDTGDPEAKDREARSIRVLIVDDHEVVRQGLRVFLTGDSTIAIVGEAEDGVQALERARQVQPDVVLMNLMMPRMDGVTATAALRQEWPETEVLILTSALDEERILAAIRAGAIGYLLKDITPEELRAAIHAAAAGQVQLASQVLAGLLREVRAPAPAEPLTERETDVLRLLARGLANKEIALQLGISEQTVKSHVRNLLNKLGVASRTQAALYGVRLGLIPQEPQS